jgi:phytoene synthase
MAAPNPSYCDDLLQRFDSDRYLCGLFAKPAQREALSAIGAFNVEVARIREQVREPLLGHMRLRWWADALDGIWAGTPPRHPVADALAEAVGRFMLDRQPFDRLLEGRARDMDDAAPATLNGLLDYAEATSASLAMAGLRVLAAQDDETQLAAREVAVAWAIVGLIRAVPFHARARRIYLPVELTREADLDVPRLFEKGFTAGLPVVVQNLVGVAVDLLERARGRRHAVSPAALPMLLPASLADLSINRLRAAAFNPFDERVQARPTWRMLRLTAARLTGRF